MTATEGWIITSADGTAHYYVNRRSLCGNYTIEGDLMFIADGGRPHDCGTCRNRASRRMGYRK